MLTWVTDGSCVVVESVLQTSGPPKAHSGKKRQSRRERGNLAILYRPYLDVIAVDACKLVLFDGQSYRRDIAEQHQCLAFRAHSPSNFCGSDDRSKM
jgi:hypothetical protein